MKTQKYFSLYYGVIFFLVTPFLYTIHNLETAADYSKMMSMKEPSIIMVYATWCKTCASFRPIFEKIAERYKKNGHFYLLNESAKELKEIVETFGIKKFPTIVYIKKDFGSLSKKIFDVKVHDFINSPEEKASESLNHIKKISSKNEFDSLMRGEKPALVLLHAPWCNACGTFKPVYSDIAKKYSDQLDFYMLDIETKELANDINALKVKNIPTTLIYRNNGKKLVKDSALVGARSVDLFEAKINELLTNKNQVSESKEESLIIIGSGPAALTAAIYAGRAGLNPLIIEGPKPGGQLMSTSYVENWPGETHILGPDLIKNLQEHAQLVGTRFLFEEVTEVNTKRPFTIITDTGKKLTTRALIIATGAVPKKIGCQGEQEYWGKGVTTCAVCDGAFYKDKKVVIIGGGDSAMENASFMTNFTNNITIIQMLDTLTALQAMQDRILKNPDIKIIYSSKVTEIHGDGNQVTHITIQNTKTNDTMRIDTDAVFIAVGLTPNIDILNGQIDLTQYGYIKHIQNTETSVPGIFAAGDVADSRYRQAITSSAGGCMAALDAERFLKENYQTTIKGHAERTLF